MADKQLIVVVHGVGINQPGICSDLLAAGLDDGKRITENKIDILIPEDEYYTENDKIKTFPSRIQRFKNDDGSKRTIAEYYWGDLSSIGTGYFSMITAFVSMVLGLSHPLRENAAELYAKDSYLKKMVLFFVWLMHGPIAAINIFLIGGVFLTWFAGEKFVDFGIYITVGFALVAWLFIFRKQSAYLGRLLGKWILYTSLVAIIMQLTIDFVSNDLIIKFTNFAVELFCSGSDINLGAAENCTSDFVGIFKLGPAFILGLVILWILVFVLLAVFACSDIAFRLFKKVDNKEKNIVLPTMFLMLLLWFLIIGAAWSSLFAINAIPKIEWLIAGFFMLPVFMLMLLFLGIVAGVAWYYKSKWSKGFEELNTSQNEYNKYIIEGSSTHRMIVHRSLLITLLFGCVATIIIGVSYTLGKFSLWTTGNYFYNILQFDENSFEIIITVLAVFTAMVFSTVSAPIKAGLEILKDIISYINNYSWKSFDLLNSDDQSAMKAGRKFEKKVKKSITAKFSVKFTEDTRKEGYFLRGKLKDRLNSLVEKVIETEKPDELIIISHSQGSVIAIDVIDERGKIWLDKIKKNSKNARIKLITMGSPYTHVQNYYFPASFAPISERENLKKVNKKRGSLTDWINIYRVDDFVGTYIDPDGIWPKEYPVNPNGHTNYWIDTNVTKIIRKFLS